MCINDLFKAGLQDDSPYSTRPTVKIKIELVEKVVLQGEVFGPLECSVSVDSFGKYYSF